MTNQEYIDRALFELGYHDYDASADATDSAKALYAMNNMHAAWEVGDKVLNWFAQDTLGDTVPVPDWAEGACVSLLAMKLGTTFNVAPPQQLYKDAAEADNLILRTLMSLKLKPADMSHLPQGTLYSSDILNGP